jgi:hypothetical protein
LQITIIPSARQIRYYLDLAISAFDTLPPEVAIRINLAALRRCQQYLDSLDHAANIEVSRVVPVESGVRVEFVGREGEFLDAISLKGDPPRMAE